MTSFQRPGDSPIGNGTTRLTDSHFFVIGISVLLFQRFGLTIGEGSVPVMVLALVVLAFGFLVSGEMAVQPMRLALILVVVVIGAVGLLLHPVNTSPASLSLAVAAWLPAVLMPAGAKPVGIRRQVKNPMNVDSLQDLLLDARAFITAIFWTMFCASCAAIIQFVSSYAFGILIDPMAALPSWMALPGFNSTYPVVWGGSWYRANGVIFLEASFLSLFAVFGLVLCWSGTLSLSTKTKIIVTTVFLVALLGSVATSGLVLVPLLIAALSRTPLGRRVMAAVVLTAIAGASSFPPILSFVSKALQNPLDTSGQVSVASRIYRPYLDVLDLIQNSPWLGIGPGSSRAYVESLDVGVTTPTLMKVTVEYGVLGLLAFSLLWFSLIQASRLSYLLKLALLVALLVPTDGLTNSLLVPLFTWMLLLTARPQSLAHVPVTLSIGRKLKGSY